MIKKITIAIIFLLLLLVGVSYFKPLQATELLAAKETLPQTIIPVFSFLLMNKKNWQSW